METCGMIWNEYDENRIFNLKIITFYKKYNKKSYFWEDFWNISLDKI